MQYALTPYSEPVEPWVWWQDVFSNEALDWLQNEAATAVTPGTVGGVQDTEGLENIRRASVKWLPNTQDTSWVYEGLGHAVSSLNSQFYRFNLTGFGEELQLTNYCSSNSGNYVWHQDFTSNRTHSRKLSLVLQLSDPSEYEGGNLQIMTGGGVQNIPKQRGLVSIFPSYTVHQVTPVTAGSRQSLVAWISGEPFK